MLATTLLNPRVEELTEAIFFRPIDKILGSFFFVFSGEAAKANEGQKAEYYADATADVLALVVS